MTLAGFASGASSREAGGIDCFSPVLAIATAAPQAGGLSGRTRLDFGDEQVRHISGMVAGRCDPVLADATGRAAAALRAHRLFAAGFPLNPPWRLPDWFKRDVQLHDL